MRKAEPLTAEVVSSRLRTLAELSRYSPLAEVAIEMSSAAVTARLLECAEITALAWALGEGSAERKAELARMRYVSPVAPARPSP